ncbi:hypothetical protein BGX33_001554 [Mortierella sp. NVP41]|nr:hypothetical protein BGX33_001554 [Mortierella sp. NVP41]
MSAPKQNIATSIKGSFERLIHRHGIVHKTFTDDNNLTNANSNGHKNKNQSHNNNAENRKKSSVSISSTNNSNSNNNNNLNMAASSSSTSHASSIKGSFERLLQRQGIVHNTFTNNNSLTNANSSSHKNNQSRNNNNAESRHKSNKEYNVSSSSTNSSNSNPNVAASSSSTSHASSIKGSFERLLQRQGIIHNTFTDNNSITNFNSNNNLNNSRSRNNNLNVADSSSSTTHKVNANSGGGSASNNKTPQPLPSCGCPREPYPRSRELSPRPRKLSPRPRDLSPVISEDLSTPRLDDAKLLSAQYVQEDLEQFKTSEEFTSSEHHGDAGDQSKGDPNHKTTNERHQRRTGFQGESGDHHHERQYQINDQRRSDSSTSVSRTFNHLPAQVVVDDRTRYRSGEHHHDTHHQKRPRVQQQQTNSKPTFAPPIHPSESSRPRAVKDDPYTLTRTATTSSTMNTSGQGQSLPVTIHKQVFKPLAPFPLGAAPLQKRKHSRSSTSKRPTQLAMDDDPIEDRSSEDEAHGGGDQDKVIKKRRILQPSDVNSTKKPISEFANEVMGRYLELYPDVRNANKTRARGRQGTSNNKHRDKKA